MFIKCDAEDRGFETPISGKRWLSMLTVSTAALSWVLMVAPWSDASAEVPVQSDSAQPYFDSQSSPAPRASRPRRNDAYQPTEPGSSLGVLSSRSDGGQERAVAQALPGDAPRYGEPVRPYESYERVPLQSVPAPNSYPPAAAPRNDSYRAAPGGYAQPAPESYSPAPYRDGPVVANQGYGQPYGAPPEYGADRNRDYRERDYRDSPPRDYDRDRDRGGRGDGTYSSSDILGAGHGFFGSISQGLGSVVENAFKRQGRPNGYILGEEGGGAFIAGLRYGEGTLYTRDAGTHRVYWQGPSFGYDFGGAGSKVMILVYNLRAPDDIFERFGGVDGSAYLVGGLGMTLLTGNHMTLAPIRSGVGLRLGANVGYLKFTPRPTWNPF